MNSWSGFCLYVAGGIFIKDQNMPNPQPQSASNLEFVLAAMRAIGKKHSVTDHFTGTSNLLVLSPLKKSLKSEFMFHCS
jgi:hypothetical protein